MAEDPADTPFAVPEYTTEELIGWPADEPERCPECFRMCGHYEWCRKGVP
jgi:hypothetical protein